MSKVNFGLEKVHYAVITEAQDGTYTYGTPKPIPGAVSMTETANGESLRFAADNGIYYAATSNQGYEQTLTFARIPDSFRVDILGETLVNGGLLETSNAKQVKFALLYEIGGDEEEDKFVYYNCTAARPTNSTTTNGDTITVNTNDLVVTISPRPYDKAVKWVTRPDTPATIKDNFYDAVVEPTPVVVPEP